MLLTELVLNKMYHEPLSGLMVIVTSISAKGLNRSLQVRFTFYNKVSGRFETADAVDGQLQPRDVYPPALNKELIAN